MQYFGGTAITIRIFCDETHLDTNPVPGSGTTSPPEYRDLAFTNEDIYEKRWCGTRGQYGSVGGFTTNGYGADLQEVHITICPSVLAGTSRPGQRPVDRRSADEVDQHGLGQYAELDMHRPLSYYLVHEVTICLSLPFLVFALTISVRVAFLLTLMVFQVDARLSHRWWLRRRSAPNRHLAVHVRLGLRLRQRLFPPPLWIKGMEESR